MRYAVYVPNFGPYGNARVLADLAYEAEEAGWDGFFLWDQVSKTTLTPTVDATKVRLGGFAPTLVPTADAAKVRLGGFAPTLPPAR